jgi:hypothetical protein
VNFDIAPVVAALVQSDLVGSVFRAALPQGAVFTVPVPMYERREGPASVVFCASGCELRVQIRRVALTALSSTMPVRATVLVEVNVASYVNGVRAPLPVRTTAGDFTVDLDTSRGANPLRYTATVRVSQDRVPPAGYVRVRPAALAESLRLLGVSVDLSALLPTADGALESADLEVRATSYGGRYIVELVNRFRDQILARLRAEANYAINAKICTELNGENCPPRPTMPEIEVAAYLQRQALGVVSLLISAGVLYAIVRRR